MIRGAIIAVILLAALDLSANDGHVVHHVMARVAAFGAASSDAIKNSIFRG